MFAVGQSLVRACKLAEDRANLCAYRVRGHHRHMEALHAGSVVTPGLNLLPTDSVASTTNIPISCGTRYGELERERYELA